MEQLEYLHNFVQIYGFKGLNDNETKISSHDIDSNTNIIKNLNNEIDNLRKHFRYSDFALNKYKNKITNGTVALGVLKKCLQQANISFDIVKSPSHNYLRLSKPNILYNKFISKLNMNQVEDSIHDKVQVSEWVEWNEFKIPDLPKSSKGLKDGVITLNEFIDNNEIFDYDDPENKKKINQCAKDEIDEITLDPLIALVCKLGKYIKYSKKIATENYQFYNNNSVIIVEILESNNGMITKSSRSFQILREADLICGVKSSHNYEIIAKNYYDITSEKYIPLISLQYVLQNIKFYGNNLLFDSINCYIDYLYADTPERRLLATSTVKLENYTCKMGLIYPNNPDNQETTHNEHSYALKANGYKIVFNLIDHSFIYDIELAVFDIGTNKYHFDYIESFGIEGIKDVVYEQKNTNYRKIFKDNNIDKDNPIVPYHGKLFIKLNKPLDAFMYISMKFKSIKTPKLINKFYVLNNLYYNEFGIHSGYTNAYLDENGIKHFSELVN